MTEPRARLFHHHIALLQHQAEHILSEQGFDRLLIHSGRPKMRFQDDQSVAFRSHPYFIQWVPLTQHVDGLLEVRVGRRPRLFLCVSEGFWHAPPAQPESWWAEEFDIEIVKAADQWQGRLDQPEVTALIAESMDFPQLGQHAALNPESLIQRFDEHRTVKTDWQIECMRQANRRAAAGHQAAATAFAAGKSELEIHLDYLRASRHDPDQLPYRSIVALNEHAAVLHYQHLISERPSTIHSFLIDAGADVCGYAADITRTYGTGNGHGHAASVFAELIDAMDALQQRLVAQVRPGQDYVELNEQAHRGVAEILHGSEICSMEIESMLEASLTTRFLPHGLGHFIGVQVHDVGGLIDATGQLLSPPESHPFLRLTRTLEKGNVLTIEPGLYFIPALLEPLRESGLRKHLNWSMIDQLIPYGGIRVEDDVVVTQAGPMNLTREAFAESRT